MAVVMRLALLDELRIRQTNVMTVCVSMHENVIEGPKRDFHFVQKMTPRTSELAIQCGQGLPSGSTATDAAGTAVLCSALQTSAAQAQWSAHLQVELGTHRSTLTYVPMASV